jgi:two-component system nitrogen regulation response regulator GlnG
MSDRSVKILIADDDRSIRTVLSQALTRHGYDVEVSENANALWSRVEAGAGDIVITDVIMPDGNGLDLVTRIRNFRPDLRVIVMSAQNTLKTAIQATERGAFDYLPKPFDLKDLVATVERALVVPAAPLPELPDEADEQLPFVGRSPAMQEVYRLIARLTTSDLTVLLTGEPGTGKELAARALHMFGTRRDKPFVSINLAALPQDTMEELLFGKIIEGRYSPGQAAKADGGILFLNAIGQLPLDAQIRLLQLLSKGEITPLNGNKAIKMDVRLIVATNRDLKILARQGSFLEELFYRLNILSIRMPSLRERLEDIPALVRFFSNRIATPVEGAKNFTSAALERLKQHQWPGNVIELENLVQRLHALHHEPSIDADFIEAALSEAAPDESSAPRVDGLSHAVERHLRDYFAAHQNELPSSGVYERVMREIERPLITLTLAATRGNQIKAAEVLGLNRNTLRKKIRDLDIPLFKGQK